MSKQQGRADRPALPLRAQMAALEKQAAEYKEALRRAAETIDRLIGEVVEAQDRQRCACELLRYAGALSANISARVGRFNHPAPAFQLGDLTVPLD